MNRRLFLFLLPLALGGSMLLAQENKPQIKIGGELYLSTYIDTYESVDSREGVSYSFPKAPNLDASGNDINQVTQFGMSPYQTRLHVRGDGFKLLNADATVFVQTDFMGASSPSFQMIRMRHAYLDLRWERDELLLGQTNNLEMVSETVSGLLTAGSGSPISILERPIMIRYGRKLSDNWKAYLAASFHHVQTWDADNAETQDANRNNGFPSVEARIQYNSLDGHLLVGVAGGYKSLMPRLQTESGKKTNERIHSGSVTAFLRYIFNGHTLKFQALYGSNLTHLGLMGGYGKQLVGGEHYDYTNFIGGSAWADFQTRSYNHFHIGLFAGYMENFGTGKPVDTKKMFANHPGLNLTGRVSPRLTYEIDNLMLGAEYSLFFSRWGKTFNSRYQPTSSYDLTYNHRLTLLAKYMF